MIYLTKLTVIVERERKTFHVKNGTKGFIANKQALQRILERMLQSERNDKHTPEMTGRK